MIAYYFDTNIFLYLFNKNSQFYVPCRQVLHVCQKNKILIYTSAETFQEIIHYAKNTKQLEDGLRICEASMRLGQEVLEVTRITIEIYLEKVRKYPKIGSRDIIYLATCLTNNLNTIVTYDKDFKKFKEIQSHTPEEIIKGIKRKSK